MWGAVNGRIVVLVHPPGAVLSVSLRAPGDRFPVRCVVVCARGAYARGWWGLGRVGAGVVPLLYRCCAVVVLVHPDAYARGWWGLGRVLAFLQPGRRTARGTQPIHGSKSILLSCNEIPSLAKGWRLDPTDPEVGDGGWRWGS